MVVIEQSSASSSGLLQTISFYTHYLYILFSCFCTDVAELSSYDRDCIAHKDENIYYLALNGKRSLTPAVENKILILILLLFHARLF